MSWIEAVELAVSSAVPCDVEGSWKHTSLSSQFLIDCGCKDCEGLADRCKDFSVTAARDRALQQKHGTPLTPDDAAFLALFTYRTSSFVPLDAINKFLKHPDEKERSAALLLCRMLVALRMVEPCIVSPVKESVSLAVILYDDEKQTLTERKEVVLERFVLAKRTETTKRSDDENGCMIVKVARDDDGDGSGGIVCYDLAPFTMCETNDFDLVLEPGTRLKKTEGELSLMGSQRFVLARWTDMHGVVACVAGTEQEPVRLKPVLNVIAASGASGAIHETALNILEHDGSKEKNAVVMLQCASKAGNCAEAQYTLAMLYMNGAAGLPQDPERAFSFFDSAARGGVADAYNNLAQCYMTGCGVDKADHAAAVCCFEKGAALGNALAANNLGLCLQNGVGTSVDHDRAFKLFTQAAETGMPDALVHLAECYLHGHGCAPDEKRALQLLHQAAESGDENARKVLDAITEHLKAKNKQKHHK